jgi:hypothetical protein
MNATSDLPVPSGGSESSTEPVASGGAPARAEPASVPLKGVRMVAAYRAERAAQRTALRASLHESHLARRRSREERLGREPAPAPPPADKVVAEAPAATPPADTRDEAAAGSVFANLVSLAVAERTSAPAVIPPDPPPPAPETVAPESVAPEFALHEPVVSEAAISEPVEPEPEAADPVVSPITTPDANAPAAVSVEPGLSGPAPAPEEPTATVAPPAEEPPPAPADEPPAEPTVASDQSYDPPLAEIGFGPGMLIRLSQLGLHTTADLAQANAGELRAALGDISRLVDVETWISNARHTTKAG